MDLLALCSLCAGVAMLWICNELCPQHALPCTDQRDASQHVGAPQCSFKLCPACLFDRVCGYLWPGIRSAHLFLVCVCEFLCGRLLCLTGRFCALLMGVAFRGLHCRVEDFWEG